MQTGIAIYCLAFAVAAFGYGFYTEWKQSRVDGPVAIVATLPFAVVAALFVSVGLVAAPVSVPWWGAGLAFPILTLILCKIAMMANGRR
jgi:hypothetical protein